MLAHLNDALWGAIIGYMSLWALYWAFKLVTGKDGVGHGDFKLLALAGAWGGWQILPLTIALSVVIALFVTLVLLRTPANKNGDIQIPFGPYIAGATWIALLWGDTINSLPQLLAIHSIY